MKFAASWPTIAAAAGRIAVACGRIYRRTIKRSVDPQAFQFEVPADAEIVKFFIPPDPGQLLAKKVPDFKFVDLDGKADHSPIAGRKDRGASIFGQPGALPCKLSLPNLQKVYEKYKDNDKVAFLAVSVDEPQVDNKAIEDLFKELKVNIPDLPRSG